MIKKICRTFFNLIFYILMIIIVILIAYVMVIRVFTKQNRIGDIPINFYTILTQSMYPKIKAGDIIITYKNSDNKYKTGDIITFVSTGKSTAGITITHRIVEIKKENGKYSYITKGDNNNTKDLDEVKSNNVIGRVIIKIPKVGYLQQFLVTKFGWIVAILLPSLGIIIYDFIKISKKVVKKTGTKKIINNKKIIESNPIEEKSNLEKVIAGQTPEKIENQVKEVYINNGIKDEKETLDNGDDSNEIEIL